jgi:hypothetical protein
MNIQISIANAIGNDFIGLPNFLVQAFINRVIADGGTFEAQSCMVSQLTALNIIA